MTAWNVDTHTPLPTHKHTHTHSVRTHNANTRLPTPFGIHKSSLCVSGCGLSVFTGQFSASGILSAAWGQNEGKGRGGRGRQQSHVNHVPHEVGGKGADEKRGDRQCWISWKVGGGITSITRFYFLQMPTEQGTCGFPALLLKEILYLSFSVNHFLAQAGCFSSLCPKEGYFNSELGNCAFVLKAAFLTENTASAQLWMPTFHFTH